MSGGGQDGPSASVGHERDTASSSKSHVVQLKCPQWFTSGKYLEAPNPDTSNSDFSSFAGIDGPKRRGRPPKTASHQPSRSSTRAKPSTLPKALGTRSSKRKLGVVNGDQDDQEDMDMADAPSVELGQEQAPQSHLDDSQDHSDQNSIKRAEADSSTMTVGLDDSIDRTGSTVFTNGYSPAKKNSENAFTTPPTAKEVANMDSKNPNEDPVPSIEAHEQLDADEDEDTGVVMHAATRSKSAPGDASTAKAPATNVVLNAEDSFSTANDAGFEDVKSAPGTPKGKGRGRWPNGALKAKAAAAGVTTATFKKSLGKKKGAPGKRKTSDNAVVQAAYDRQARLRSQYKDLRKMLLKSEVAYLERTLEDFEGSPDAFMDTPNYEEVMKFLEQRRTEVVATREKEEQLHKQLLQRTFDGEVSNSWQIFSGTVKDLMVKYEMKGKRAYLDVIQQQRAEEDEYLTDSEVEGGEYELDKLDDVIAEQDSLTEAPTTEDNEPAKKGRVTKPKRGKKRALEDEPLVQQVVKRHATAMLSATTLDEEADTEADKPSVPLTVVAAGPRGKNKYHFDQYGVFVPTEAKKGPQREEPNNRAVIEPWFEFEPHEIGLRNLYDEKNELKPKPQLPTGYWHVDPHRGVYNIQNREDDYDQKLVLIFGVHPTMGLPCKGSRNPDDAFKHTDYINVLKNIPTPLRYIGEEHPEPVSTSRSWDIITTARDWLQFESEVRVDPALELKERYGREGLATYDLEARAYNDGIYVVDDLLDAAEALERETPKPEKRTVSPSPGKRQSARQKAKAEAAASKARAVTPVTPVPAPQPLPAPPITSTASLSILADASELVQKEFMPSPQPHPHHAPPYPYQHSPPAPRTQSQLPLLSFINNPMPPNERRPLAPQPQQPQHHPESRPFLQPRPQPMEMQRQYERPGMMAPPPLQPRMPLPYPGMPQHQPHHSPLFYHQSPPQQPQPPQRPNLRPGGGPGGLRSLLPRTMPGDPPGPPTSQHHHVNHQQVTFYPGPPPQHMGPEHPRYYDGPHPPQHISPYRNEPYQPYTPGPLGPPGPPSGPPPGYGPFRHHSPRR